MITTNLMVCPDEFQHRCMFIMRVLQQRDVHINGSPYPFLNLNTNVIDGLHKGGNAKNMSIYNMVH